MIGYAIGLVLGLLLLLTRRGGLTQNVIVYNILDKIVNIVRSIPFIILMALLVGVTRVIVGTSIGTEAMIVPIAGATVPFYARQVENALLEIDPGLVEAAKHPAWVRSTSYGACTCAKARADHPRVGAVVHQRGRLLRHGWRGRWRWFG